MHTFSNMDSEHWHLSSGTYNYFPMVTMLYYQSKGSGLSALSSYELSALLARRVHSREGSWRRYVQLVQFWSSINIENWENFTGLMTKGGLGDVIWAIRGRIRKNLTLEKPSWVCFHYWSYWMAIGYYFDSQKGSTGHPWYTFKKALYLYIITSVSHNMDYVTIYTNILHYIILYNI